MLNGEEIDLINVTYLKFERWVQIACTDGNTTVSEVENDFESINGYGDAEYQYPLTNIKDSFLQFNKYIGKRCLSITELVTDESFENSFGLNFYFEEGLNFIIHNKPYPEDRNEYLFENLVPGDLKEIVIG